MSRVVPFEFILEELHGLELRTKPMFGCEAVYVGEKIVLILRDKKNPVRDDGVWIATLKEHHESLRAELPPIRSLELFGGDTDWQVLPVEDERFEELALRTCELVRAGDPRIGRVPKSRASKSRPKAARKAK